MNEEQMQLLGEKVVEVLHSIYDPEIPVDICLLYTSPSPRDRG